VKEIAAVIEPGALTRRRRPEEESMKPAAIVLAILIALPLSGCQTAYYSAMEKVGYHKRDILAGRVKTARDSQEEAKKEIVSALEEFGKVVNYRGGEIEEQYNRMNAKLADAETAAEAVRTRIKDVENVGEALFDEWKSELSQYSSAELRTKSERQLRATRGRYDTMVAAMKRAESRLEPALRPMRDQVLYLKHNLNARAIAGIKGEVSKVDAQVNQLVAELNRAIAEADTFIRQMDEGAE
jgi:chromosome segregation ATPase